MNKEECAICLEQMEHNVVKLLCQHKFHFECITKWNTKKNECPFCRRKIEIYKKCSIL